MDATPFDFGDAWPLSGLRPPMGIDSPSPGPIVAQAATWTAIHEAAAILGALAGVDQGRITTEIQLGLGADLPSWDVLDDPMQDLAEILRRGISALLTAHVSGGAPKAAALALWDEFLLARALVLWPEMSRDASPTHP